MPVATAAARAPVTAPEAHPSTTSAPSSIPRILSDGRGLIGKLYTVSFSSLFHALMVLFSDSLSFLRRFRCTHFLAVFDTLLF
jgi:hypothetical protein